MTARDMVVTRLSHSMSVCSNALTQFREYIQWQDTCYRLLQDFIRSVFGEDPRVALLASKLQHCIDRMFNAAEPIALASRIQIEMEDIGALLNDVNSVSTGELYRAKESVDSSRGTLLNTLLICYDKDIEFLKEFKDSMEKLLSERAER